ncbi:MAG: 50S ribosomal protein L13 [Armatimonadetes bacterium]|nr:50S ribosomal protein L13 [Armatimonadota bacterium]
MNNQKVTRSAKADDVQHEWFIVSARGVPLGRLASKVAHVLRGKHKATYTPHVDTGDFVIITDAAEVIVTGNKATQKIYYRHSGYPGGLKAESFKHYVERAPEKLVREAVEGMLTHNVLGRQQLRKLKVYAGSAHPHQAQQPRPLEL